MAQNEKLDAKAQPQRQPPNVRTGVYIEEDSDNNEQRT
jgi:hypothetical protein